MNLGQTQLLSLAVNGDPDPISAGTAGEAAPWGGSSAVVGMAANPLGAHRVGAHTAGHMACRYASGHDAVRACRCRRPFSHSSGTPLLGLASSASDFRAITSNRWDRLRRSRGEKLPRRKRGPQGRRRESRRCKRRSGEQSASAHRRFAARSAVPIAHNRGCGQQ